MLTMKEFMFVPEGTQASCVKYSYNDILLQFLV
jgi:hypothetical protein